MCNRCEENMTIIAERTSIPRSIVEEVYAVQKALIVEEETREMEEAVAEAERIAEHIADGTIDVQAMAAEQIADPTAIPGFIMEALVAGIGGPVVVIGARPIEGAEAMLTITASGTDGAEVALRMCSGAVEALSSPLIETGGVGADGTLIAPMRRRSTRPES